MATPIDLHLFSAPGLVWLAQANTLSHHPNPRVFTCPRLLLRNNDMRDISSELRELNDINSE